MATKYPTANGMSFRLFILCPKKRGEKKSNNMEISPHNPLPKRNPNRPIAITPKAPTKAHTTWRTA